MVIYLSTRDRENREAPNWPIKKLFDLTIWRVFSTLIYIGKDCGSIAGSIAGINLFRIVQPQWRGRAIVLGEGGNSIFSFDLDSNST